MRRILGRRVEQETIAVLGEMSRCTVAEYEADRTSLTEPSTGADRRGEGGI